MAKVVNESVEKAMACMIEERSAVFSMSVDEQEGSQAGTQ